MSGDHGTAQFPLGSIPDEVTLIARTSAIYHSYFLSQSKITGDEGEVYVFEWLSATERALKEAPVVRQCV